MPLHGTWKSLHHSEMTEAKKFNLDDGIFKTVTLPLVAEKRWRRGFTPVRASFGNWLPILVRRGKWAGFLSHLACDKDVKL